MAQWVTLPVRLFVQEHRDVRYRYSSEFGATDDCDACRHGECVRRLEVVLCPEDGEEVHSYYHVSTRELN